jgi:hypothetical protein
MGPPFAVARSLQICCAIHLENKTENYGITFPPTHPVVNDASIGFVVCAEHRAISARLFVPPENPECINFACGAFGMKIFKY